MHMSKCINPNKNREYLRNSGGRHSIQVERRKYYPANEFLPEKLLAESAKVAKVKKRMYYYRMTTV